MDAVAEAEAHIDALEDESRRAEAKALDKIFRDATGYLPKLWSGRMIGYGSYDYTYDSGHSGTSLATGFATAKRQITLYILPGYTAFPQITARLGKHRHGKCCFYFNKLADADEAALRDLIRAGLDDLGRRWTIDPT